MGTTNRHVFASPHHVNVIARIRRKHATLEIALVFGFDDEVVAPPLLVFAPARSAASPTNHTVILPVCSY